MIEELRRNVITGLRSLKSVKRSWPVWMSTIRSAVGDVGDPTQILGIADRLKQVFDETKGPPSRNAAEEQSAASGGGAAWEALVCWYLNLCLIGTSAVVVKKRKQLAGPIADAITARYNNESVNSEADLLAVTFPERLPFVAGSAPVAGWNLRAVNTALASGGMGETAITVIQCKTNWNDNAQIPMLWDLIYRPDSHIGGKVAVGVNNYGPKNVKSFRYAFVTVPTSRGPFKRESVKVLRVNALSGGNYWGKKSESGVAMCLSDIFARACIGPENGAGVRAALLRSLPELRTKYEYLGL